MKNNDALELLRRLVSIDSVNPFQTIEVDGEELGIGNETNINLFLEETLQELGFSTKRQIVQEARIVEKNGEARKIPERWNLLAEKGEGERALLLFGHSDTVDVKDGWKTDPFLLSQDHLHGRKIHRGLGANDMKGGLAALVAAVSRVDELPKGWKLKIAILVDEEFWSYGAVQLLKSDFINDVKLALVPEIADALPDPSVQFLGLGRLGRAEFVVDVHGKACHGAFALIDPEAVNAVHESVHLQSVFIRYAQKSASRFEAGKISIENSAYINHHAGGKGVLSVPDFASFIFDRTLIPGEDLLEEQQKLLNLILLK